MKKLRAARERKRREAGQCEGRKTRIERARKAKDEVAVAKLQEAVAMAKRLRRANPVTGMRRSLRRIAKELAAAGHLNEWGQPSMQ